MMVTISSKRMLYLTILSAIRTSQYYSSTDHCQQHAEIRVASQRDAV